MSDFRSLDVDYQSLVNEFGVQYVVEGSLRRAGNKLRMGCPMGTAKVIESVTF